MTKTATAGGIRELSSPQLDQSVRCPVYELSIPWVGSPRVGVSASTPVIPCLHDITGCQTSCTTGFTAWQPVWQPCWTNSHCSLNWLSNPVWQPCWTNSCSFNRLSNRVVQPVWQQLWQPCWTNSHCSFNRVERTATVRSTMLNEQPLFVQPCWMNSHCSFNRLSNRVVQLVWQPAAYTIQPFVKPVQPVWQPVSQRVWQPVVSCIQSFTQLSNPLTTGLTTGCIV